MKNKKNNTERIEIYLTNADGLIIDKKNSLPRKFQEFMREALEEKVRECKLKEILNINSYMFEPNKKHKKTTFYV